jgi:hypothetical protein
LVSIGFFLLDDAEQAQLVVKRVFGKGLHDVLIRSRGNLFHTTPMGCMRVVIT